MNIFVLDTDPVAAAWATIDKHAVKMPLETAQIGCTVARSLGFDDVAYRSTHARHPCTLWAASSDEAWDWTLRHGLALCDTYSARYQRQHASEAILRHLATLKLPLPRRSMPDFAQAMPDAYRHADAVTAYRAYYRGEKARMATWRQPAQTPDWWQSAT